MLYTNLNGDTMQTIRLSHLLYFGNAEKQNATVYVVIVAFIAMFERGWEKSTYHMKFII